MHKPISEIQVHDHVVTWDDHAGHLARATVIGIDTFPAEHLLEISFNATTHAMGRLSAASLHHFADIAVHKDSPIFFRPQVVMGGQRRLIVTADHPIFSARLKGLVSMEPARTQALYGLNSDVGQMGRWEVLHDYMGNFVEAEVLMSSNDTPEVMTLRLDQHHWFFANGVRVHNKGHGHAHGHAHGEGHGRSVHRSVVRTRASFISVNAFAMFIVLNSGSRRRYGTYLQDPASKCLMKPANETESACANTMLKNSAPSDSLLQNSTASSVNASKSNHTGFTCCYDCISCDSKECVNSIPQCSAFLAEAFEECTQDDESSDGEHSRGDTWFTIVIVLFFFCMCYCLPCAKQQMHVLQQGPYSQRGHVQYSPAENRLL